LWLSDQPLSYLTSRGQPFTFQLTYKQRDTRAPTIFSTAGWNNSWQSYVHMQSTVIPAIFGQATGQRLGDIATLTKENLDLGSKEIRLTTGKTGRRQILALAEPLLKFVKTPLPVMIRSGHFSPGPMQWCSGKAAPET
jgi:integrase